MDLSKKILSDIRGSPCPICKRERFYKSNQGAIVGATKPCRSCTNSISAGGQGWSNLCFDCNVNPRIYNSLCKECHNSRSKKYHKETYRWAKYGLDGPPIMERCEICSSTLDLCIDHCHTTSKFRGILCKKCNSALGLLQENKELLKKAVEYAERTFHGLE